MERQKLCDLCGRSYSPEPLAMHLTLRKDDQPELVHDYDICLMCTYKLHKLISDIRATRPKKCEFCEFERSPRVAQTTECVTCSKFKNFQLKKRMHPRQAHEWETYKRYLCGGD